MSGVFHIHTSEFVQRAPEFSCGDELLLTGEIYALRDAGHLRLLAELERQGSLPYDLAGKLIFYAGPTPAPSSAAQASGVTSPFGAIGPTTASRMDFATPALIAAGIAGMIGKGVRSAQVHEACAQHQALYCVAVGGAAARMAQSVISEEVIAYPDLGTEALRRLVVQDFSVFVEIDARGADLYQQAQEEAQALIRRRKS